MAFVCQACSCAPMIQFQSRFFTIHQVVGQGPSFTSSTVRQTYQPLSSLRAFHVKFTDVRPCMVSILQVFLSSLAIFSFVQFKVAALYLTAVTAYVLSAAIRIQEWSFHYCYYQCFAFALCSMSYPPRQQFFFIKRCKQMRCHTIREKQICNCGHYMERNLYKMGEVIMNMIFCNSQIFG